MAAVAMATKVQKMLYSLQTSQMFAVGINRTNFAAVAMEIKKGGFNFS
jgi:hypothetical protein